MNMNNRVFSIGACNETDKKPKGQYGLKKRRHQRLSRAVVCKKTKTACDICTDLVDGKVSLKCGHEMCPTCFARHARENNTCPFCRDVFAPKVVKQEHLRMPFQVAEAIASTNVQEYYYEEAEEEIENLLENLKDNTSMTGEKEKEKEKEIKDCIYHHMFHAAINMYYDIDGWLDDNEE